MSDRQPRASYIIKVSGQCNLECRYCYYYNGSSRVDRTKMDAREIEHILRQASSLAKCIKLEWHGGEPLLIGLDTFQEIIDLQRSLARETGTRFRNTVQTNGTLLDEHWVGFLQENEFTIGVSLDGPQWLHDANRCYPSGRGSHADTCQGVELLQRSGMSFGALSVITRESIGHEGEIYEFFTKRGIKHIGFLPCVEFDFGKSKPGDFKLTEHSLRPGDLSRFMIRLFDLWMEQDDPTVSIRELKQMLMGLLGGQPTLCTFMQTCSDHITINDNGDVGPCSNLSAKNLNGPNLRFGNIWKEQLTEILDGDQRKRFLETSTVATECNECSYFRVCGGGCAKHQFMWAGNWQESNYFCNDMKQIIEHIVQSLRKNHPSLCLSI